MRDWIRRYLGTDTLEETMATWTDVLNNLVAQTTAASAAQATSFSNLQNGLDRQGREIAELRELLANGGEVTPEMQALADQIGQSLTDMKNAADTADNGFEPNPDVPAEPGDGTDPADGDTGDQGDVLPEDSARP